ncbi:MAG: TonB-dependent hemoglobin/transferrin/lactoferrin family receptor [Hyphomonadaceae bacterium]
MANAGIVRGARARWLGASALAALSALGATAHAQEQEFAQITVTATRTPIDAINAPNTVSVITAADIEENLATDIKDLIRFEPGVSVSTSPSRFGAALAATGRDGNSSFTIRGLGGNRVLFTVDGVRVPDGFSFGPATFGRGDYVDLDLLQSVEIVRGPASALYGSDGLAGVVSFITKDPADFLAEGESFGGRARVGYAEADESWSTGLSAVGRAGDWSGLVALSRRDARETDNQGENNAFDASRTAPNPQDIESNSAMARLVFEPSAQHRFRVTGEYADRDIITEAFSGRTTPPAVGVTDLDGRDESERSRIGLDYTFENDGGAIDRAFLAVYAQDAQLSQFSDEDRAVLADRTRLTEFDNQVWGAAAQLESRFAFAGAQHRLTYGGDYSSTRQEGLRDGTVPPVGEPFPSRPFPNTDYDLAGLFVQDEISFMDGRVVFYPALRYDHYELTPEQDALYTAPVEGQSDSRVTPRIGIVAWPTETLGVFFNYAQGFKAPSPSQVNNSFANPLFGYTSVPNPDLGPETSDAAEIGLRLRDVNAFGGTLRASATAFTASYDDFIEQAVVGGSFTPMDPAIFQYVNLGSVEVSGLEGRADINWENGFGLTLSASTAEGEQESGGVTAPLESVDPFKFVAGLSYADPGGRFGGQAIVTHSAQKPRGETAVGNFRPEAFTILDLTAYWNLTDAATFRVGVFNVFDETYWWWSDVRGLSEASAVRDAWTQPGRNISASISYRF